MSKSGIVNVRMVITEEKIISNIDKVQKLINPNNKKQIVQLEEDTYFKDLVESIKTYLIEYPNKKNFPSSVYHSAYSLVEYAINQFEENTKKVEELIRQREENIELAGILSELFEAADENQEDFKERLDKEASKFSEEIVDSLNVINSCKEKTEEKYVDACKLIKAKINNLESNLHIEIDMERLEDSSKALSFIGIEVSDALKLIPTPEEDVKTSVEPIIEEAQSQVAVPAETKKKKLFKKKEKVEVQTVETPIEEKVESKDEKENVAAIEEYQEATTFEAKPSLWQRFKNSKFVRAATFIFRVKVRIELPTNSLPEGRGDNQ